MSNSLVDQNIEKSISTSCQLLYVSGDQSGIGKSSVCLGILHLLITKLGYSPSSLAYIKPATQCEDTQLISKWCEDKGIKHLPVGPMVFYAGYTQQCIDGTAPDTLEQRHAAIKEAVDKISQGKRLVLVDGVGYPAVGSVCGVSNADVAKLLDAPVLLVGRGGVGNAIDATNLLYAYFTYHSVTVLGSIYNRILLSTSYHSYDSCKKYVTKYYEQHSELHLHTYGFIPVVSLDEEKTRDNDTSHDIVDNDTCVLRPANKGIILSSKEKMWLTQFIPIVEKSINIELIMKDINDYYGGLHPLSLAKRIVGAASSALANLNPPSIL